MALPGSSARSTATRSRGSFGRACQAAVVGILLAAVLAGVPAAADNHLSTDPKVVEARELHTAGRHEDAVAVLRPLVADATRPDRTDVRFLLGLNAIEAAARQSTRESQVAFLDEAIAALHAILIDRPGLVRARLELARAFFMKGEDALARTHFEHVLAGKPLPAVATNVNLFLSAIRARRNWTAYGGAALAPDSNIGSSTESDTIYIFGLPFQRNNFQGVTSGLGLSVWGGGEYQYPLRPDLRIRAGADGSRREYGGRDFDQTFASVHVGPRWLIGRRTEASLLANGRRRWLGGEESSTAFGARLEVAHLVTPRWRARGQLTWHDRDWAQEEDASRDGPVMSLFLGSQWAVSPTVRVSGAVGYNRDRTETLNWRNANRWVRAGVSVNLPLGFTVGAGAEYHRTQYKGDWHPFTPNGASRSDRTRFVNVSVYNRAFTVLGLSPQLVLVNESRTSNAQLYDYQRNRAELRFQRQF